MYIHKLVICFRDVVQATASLHRSSGRSHGLRGNGSEQEKRRGKGKGWRNGRKGEEKGFSEV